MIRKHFSIADESLEIIRQIMKREKLPSESAAVNYALQFYERQTQEEADNMKNVLDASRKTMAIMKGSFRETERMTAIILDAINTILMERGYQECYPAGTMPSRVIQESERLQKKRIIKMKQMKDHRLSRRK